MIQTARAEFAKQFPNKPVGPIAVNLPMTESHEDLNANLRVCEELGVNIIISAQGDPTKFVKNVHDWGAVVWHDVTTLRFAKKAAKAGVDGIICIGFGGGGHSGTVNSQILVSQVRDIFDGIVLSAGGISTGSAVHAAEIIGADLAYMGTRFIPTIESRASWDYKQMIISSEMTDLKYAEVSGKAPASWLVPSLVAQGVSEETILNTPLGGRIPLPQGVRPWFDVWSAGQGISFIHEVQPTKAVVSHLASEYESSVRQSRRPDLAQLSGRDLWRRSSS